MHRKPLLEVINVKTGSNILPALNGLWIEVKITDNDGKESDEAEIVCMGPPNRVALPKKGDEYIIFMGWSDTGLVEQGRYSVQKVSARGSPEQGETLIIKLRSADFNDKLKASGKEHYEAETFGARLKKVAQKAGLEVVVDPELANKQLPYGLRWDQSLIDFATEQGEEVGVVVKPAGGKLIATKRGASKSASGKDLEPITIT